MKKLHFLLFFILSICTTYQFAEAQTIAEKRLEELEQKIETTDKQFQNTLCNRIPLKCDPKARAEYYKFSNELQELRNEKTLVFAQIQQERRNKLDEASTMKWLEKQGISPILLLGIPIIIGWIIWAIIKKATTKKHPNSHGSADWATDKELKLKGFIKSEANSGNLVIGIQEDKNLVVLPKEFNFKHTAIVGGSGTGKSRFFFMPNLFYLKNKVSVFVHDTKSELWETTSGHWTNALRLAPYDPDNSISFNWIPYCTDENSLLTIDLAETIVSNGNESKSSDSFWEDSEIALLAGIFSHVATTDCPTPAYAYDIITTLNLDQLIEVMRNSKSKFANEQANFVEDAPDKIKQAILTGVRRTLIWLRDEKVRRFTSSTTEKADLDILRRQQIAIYWCLPQTYGERLRPLTCLALKLLMFQLRQSKGESVYLLLDEFDALGKIPRFESDLTLLRSEQVAIVASIQSIAQLAKNYGKESAQVIFDNLQTKITLHGLEYETAERISKNLGEFTLIEDSISTSSSFLDKPSTTTSERKHARRLLTADEIRRLDEKLALTITGNIKPFVKTKILFDLDIPPTTKNKCGEVETKQVIRSSNTMKKIGKIPEFPNLEAE